MAFDLAIVMPVYNEKDCIVSVVTSWISLLSGLNIKFRIIILNDGSRDGTWDTLEAFRDDARIELINKPNSGHGPTILQGYRRAVEIADWTFQCDSDDEMKPDGFPILWKNREAFAALFGVRKNRQQSFGRRFISACSRITVRMLFGKSVSDVNTPYRLIRSTILKQIVQQIPNNTFAPNVIISGVLSRHKLPIYEHTVPHESRKTGEVSIAKWNLWKSALKSFRQTLFCRPTIKITDH
jgi:glycosyltransferase involved in cell wall biosynthesis